MINTNTHTMTVTKFDTEEFYFHGWAGDSNLFTHWFVLRRTNSFLWIQEAGRPNSEVVKVKVSIRNNEETVKPYGSYSMAPVMRATKFSDFADTIKR